LTLAAKEVKGSYPSIANCCKEKKGYKTHKGFIWKFLDNKVTDVKIRIDYLYSKRHFLCCKNSALRRVVADFFVGD
jgi:hypothetical protein